jgi:hypothetical protein
MDTVDLEFYADELVDKLREIRSGLTPEIRRRILSAMELERCETDFNEDDRLWCFTHKTVANHCAPDGDESCCGIYARNEGCSCCEGNRV